MEMGPHAEGIGKQNSSHTLAVLLEEASQVSGEGTKTIS
jgi:hypothetical protein